MKLTQLIKDQMPTALLMTGYDDYNLKFLPSLVISTFMSSLKKYHTQYFVVENKKKQQFYDPGPDLPQCTLGLIYPSEVF